jgi:ADP-heptose:LPS heptosyltransferase
VDLVQWIKYLPDEYDYVCLQNQIRDADRQTLQSCSRITNVESYLKSFTDTAALLETLDLVISVDTSLAHLSGAMGKPTWVLLSFLADWRWLVDRTDCPWYPTATLYRQSVAGEWDSVLAEVKQDLLLQLRIVARG